MSETTKEERDSIRYVKPRCFMPERVLERLCNDADAADQARQEAAKLRAAMEKLKDTLRKEVVAYKRHGDEHSARLIDFVCGAITEALHSSDAPASEPEEDTCKLCGWELDTGYECLNPRCRNADPERPDYDPDPADRPEPSEALERDLLDVAGAIECPSYASSNVQDCMADGDCVCEHGEQITRLRKAISQPAPAAQKPFAWYRKNQGREMLFSEDYDGPPPDEQGWVPVYLQPAPAVPDDFDEAVELMARIIERHEDKPPGPSDPPFDYQPAWIIDTYFRHAKRALAAQPRESPAVPDGYVLVPKEPTEAMVSAGYGVHPCPTGQEKVTDAYRAMIVAAPTPDEGEADE